MRFSLFSLLFLISSLAFAGCGSARGATRGERSDRADAAAGRDGESLPSNVEAIRLEQTEGPADTIRFHIGSPFFLRLRIDGDRACAPFSGQPFYFDATGAQMGWGFEEIADSAVFPRETGCERTLMLSSENSNRLAEGYYTMKVQIYLDEKSRLSSNTIVVHAVRSAQGADERSYARFLQEQIVKNTPLLTDPETLRALFADGVPKSAESEVYRAIILYRSGDYSGAEAALSSAQMMAARRNAPLSVSATAARKALIARIQSESATR